MAQLRLVGEIASVVAVATLGYQIGTHLCEKKHQAIQISACKDFFGKPRYSLSYTTIVDQGNAAAPKIDQQQKVILNATKRSGNVIAISPPQGPKSELNYGVDSFQGQLKFNSTSHIEILGKCSSENEASGFMVEPSGQTYKFELREFL